ncbi:nuclear protein MDM1 isoform X4 [Homalodisca vitripennis]|uniref:nuclear protein MDM1 isoform X4 n=2 Tax=Homalodisca vitripennis TaxID=197043 RepID=UPI001EEBFC41|nr:nuclear protein MDM1 isoform X4 [Homalodisca vitripennis]
MIGTFWNLCRACPSMPVDKLHSEYRSTYRWHEYTGPRQEIIRKPPQSQPQGGAPAPTPRAPDEDAQRGDAVEQSTGQAQSIRSWLVVHSPFACSTSTSTSPGPGGFEPALPRRKKNPALAYKTHEFLAMSDGVGSNESLDASVVVDRARSEERSGTRARGLSRRSKSEGPPGESEYRIRYLSPRARKCNMHCDSGPNNFEQDLVMIATVQPTGGALKNAISRISTEYRLQFAWPKGSKEQVEDKAAAGAGPPRKSLSMGAIKPTSNIMPLNTAIAAVHKKRITDADRKYGAELEPLVGWGADSQDDGFTQDDGGEEKIQEESLSKEEKSQPKLSRAEFHSEYKKNFRPFSQYDYVEGKFKAKKEPEPVLVHELAHGDSWYREVLELRKKAGEYKHRGWGTELVPQHIAELYNKQMTLWEQVSRRSSLSALSLASTTPRSISKEEKEKENNKKSSPTKPPWSRQSPSRHVSPQKKVEKMDDNKKESARSRKEAVIRHHLERTTGAVDGALLHSPTREKLEPVLPRRKEDNSEQVSKSTQKPSHSTGTSGRSHSVGPNTTYSSENRSPKRSMRSGTAAASSKTQANGPIPAEKRNRPTTLSTTAPSRTKSNSGSRRTPKEVAMKPDDKTKENAGETENVDGVTEPEEPTEPEPVIDVEPVVKSPPEPTRVKSPEQILMRSPEPVNWTVPLDTGKTFTVTQNVHEGDLITRPHSEAKAWTPPAAPPAAPQSAPPQLPESEGEQKVPTQLVEQTDSLLVLDPPKQNGFTEQDSLIEQNSQIDQNGSTEQNSLTEQNGPSQQNSLIEQTSVLEQNGPTEHNGSIEPKSVTELNNISQQNICPEPVVLTPEVAPLNDS